ncbi:MAG: thioredoxin family protein [Thermodesulfobacteriota bacterium]
MSDADYTRIRVGDVQVGLLGMKESFLEVIRSHEASQWDEQVWSALLELLRRRNYIPSSAEGEYKKAIEREFRTFLGQDVATESPHVMLVQVLGPGCSQCNRLEQVVRSALSELNLPASLEHVTELNEIAKHGVVSTPALVINGKLFCMGKIPSPVKIREWLTKEAPVPSPDSGA